MNDLSWKEIYFKKSEKQISAEKVRQRVTGCAFKSTYLLGHIIKEIQQLFNIYCYTAGMQILNFPLEVSD